MFNYVISVYLFLPDPWGPYEEFKIEFWQADENLNRTRLQACYSCLDPRFNEFAEAARKNEDLHEIAEKLFGAKIDDYRLEFIADD